MKVLLSTPPLHPYQSYNFKFPRFPILNLTLLASLIRARHEVRIVNHAASPSEPDRARRVAAEFAPDVVAFAVPSPVAALHLEAEVAALKKARPGLRVAMGGPFATAEPEYCRRTLGGDAVFVGEAESTFPAWLEAPASLTDQPGLVEDLDVLPTPAWDLLDYEPVIYTGRRAAAVEASRGCPYRCEFCTVGQHDRPYRAKSSERVIAELEELWDGVVRELLFVDDSFALRDTATAEIAEAMLTRGWAFEFGAYLRADLAAAQPALVRQLARAGLRYAIVGFESYHDGGLAAMRKGTVADVNLAGARALRAAGVFVIGTHIYGTSGEPWTAMGRTYKLGSRHSDLFKAGLFTPLPGSPFFARLKQQGRLSTTDPLAMDYVHYRMGGVWRRFAMQTLATLLVARYYFGPRRWLQVWSADRWRRMIFRVEYKTLIKRVIAMLPGDWRRAKGPSHDGV